MMQLSALLVLASAALVRCQRPTYAGSRPIGIPVVNTPTTEGLADRFGEVNVTTQRIPIEANGDRELIDRLSKLPIDKQPFWFINWQALEAHRQNPQTYPQKPNVFIEPPQHSGSTGNSNFVNPGSPIVGNTASSSLGNFGNSGNSNTGNTGIPNRVNINTGRPNSGSSLDHTRQTTNAPKVNSNLVNRNPGGSISNSANSNSATLNSPSNIGSGALADRFGGIELNQFY